MTGGTAYKVFSKKANYGSASWTTDLYVYVVQGAQSVANNTTQLTLGMYAYTPGSAYGINWTDFGGSYIGIGAFGGGAETLTSFKKNASGGGTMWLVENISVTVKHNSDGSAQNVPIKWKWGVNSPWGQYVTPSGTLHVNLTTIPRVSKVTTSGGTIGSPLTINISRESSGFTHTLKYAYGSASGTITTKTASTSVSWTPPLNLCSQIPNDPSGWGTITCETYSGTTLVGSSSTQITLTVPSSVGLTLSPGWASVAAYNAGTPAAGMSGYVQSYSKAQVAFNSGKISTANSYGAGIKSYRVVYDGKDIASPYITSALQRSGEFSVTCYVTDTRDRTQSETLTFTVQEYASPTVSDITCVRCTSGGVESDEGTYIYVKATTVYSPLSGANTITLRARYKSSAGSYGSYTALTSGAGKVIGNGAVLPTSTYVVEITAVDTLGGAAVYTAYIPTAEVFFHGRRGGNGAGLGMYSQHEGGLDMAWDLYMNGNKIHDNGGFPRSIDLDIQKDYMRSVIALCEVSPTGSSTSTFTSALLSLSRINSLYAPTCVMVSAGDAYSLDYGMAIGMHGFAAEATVVRPCTFSYNGKKYGGVEYYATNAGSEKARIAILDGNFDVFGLDYYDTRGTVINSEVNNSIEFIKYTPASKMISI